MITVELQYFKPSGKYYTHGDFKVEKNLHLYEIWALVNTLRKNSNLPGLNNSPGDVSDFMILVNVPGHCQEHPKILFKE